MRERYGQGMTYDEYKARMPANREALERQERGIEIYASDLLALKSLPERLNALAIVERDSEDAVTSLPVLGRLASDSGTLNVRVFLRDENPDLMSSLKLADEPAYLPALVLFDAGYQEIGRLVGPPPSAAETIGELVAIVKEHQARLRNARKLAPPPTTKPTHPVKVTITYCAACGYEPQTIELVQALMLRSRFDLASIEIVVGEEGAFEVIVGGELVHSMYRDGGFPDPETIVGAVKAHLTDGDQVG